MEGPIFFELVESEEDKKRNKSREKVGYSRVASKVIIKRGEKEIGHIFTPSGSSNDTKNAIQVCGFTEAFDLWGCGVFPGYKDIQLLFDNGVMGGVFNNADLSQCCRCFRDPCQCENKVFMDKNREEIETPEKVTLPNPFNVKREEDIRDRISKVIRERK